MIIADAHLQMSEGAAEGEPHRNKSPKGPILAAFLFAEKIPKAMGLPLLAFETELCLFPKNAETF